MHAFDDIAYSEIGQAGRDIFLAEFSDVMFYFEDAEHEPVYEKLISIIAPSYLTNAIACLGGKDNVLKVARAKNDINRPRVFIVDKDFDDILGKTKTHEGLIYLDRYCLENYLASFPAILAVAIDRFSLRGTKAHADCGDFEKFYKDIMARYEMLTRLFLVARKNRLAIPTTKIPVSDFITGESVTDIFPSDFLVKYTNCLIEYASKECDWITPGPVLDSLIATAFEYVMKEKTPRNDPVIRHFCGKHLFGIIKHYVELATSVNFDDIPITSLYMDIMGRVEGFKQSLENITLLIKETVDRQRNCIHA